MNIFEKIKLIPPSELEAAGIIIPAATEANGFPTYICPFCGNGAGDKGDGLSVLKYEWGFNYCCFSSCAAELGEPKNYTAVDLIAEYFGFNSRTKAGLTKTADKAREIFNLYDSSYTFNGEEKFIPPKNKKVAAPMAAQATEEKSNLRDYSGFYQIVQSQLVEIGESYRGLSCEDFRAVGAGFATAADLKALGEKVPANLRYLIFPFNSVRFFMRSIGNSPKVKRNNTGAKKNTAYNPFHVDFEKPVFVVEGIFDCLSVHKAGFQAVAIDGLAWSVVISELERFSAVNPKVIIMFDNNDNGAGQQNAEKFLQALKSSGYMAENFILSPNEKYDANEFLQKDFEGFKKRLTEIYQESERKFAEMVIHGKNEVGKIVSLSDTFDKLDEFTARNKRNSVLTGFPSIDSKLPLLPGCYLLGALPSMGKTTLALNIAANVSEQKFPVLYVNYEQSQFDMALKDLARYWFMKNRVAYGTDEADQLTPTATDIRMGRYVNTEFNFDAMRKVRQELKRKREQFYFLQGTTENAEMLIEKMDFYVNHYGVKFVVIDYVQRLPPSIAGKNSVRENVDATLAALTTFQQRNDLILFFVSSFNRQNYHEFVAFESFKESGNLEYSADCVFGLQFKLQNESDRAKKSTTQEQKTKNPRQIEFVCLKNRYGENFTAEFRYFARHDCFVEKSDSVDDFVDV